MAFLSKAAVAGLRELKAHPARAPVALSRGDTQR